MEKSTNDRLATDEVDAVLANARLPSAPLAIPKQVLEVQMSWLFSIYSRLLRRA